MAAKKKETAVRKPDLPAHSKEQLLRSRRYRMHRDLLGALLEEGREYTLEEVEKEIEHFTKGKVL